MADSDEDLIDFGQDKSDNNVNSRKMERRTTQGPGNDPISRISVPLLKRSATASDATTTLRPQLSQFTSTSDDFLQKTKSGLQDLAGLGRDTLKQAGSSMTGFRERMLQRENSWNNLLRPAEGREEKRMSLREEPEDSSDDESTERLANLRRQPEAQLKESDRIEIESQLSAHFGNLKMMSKPAFGTVTSATSRKHSDLRQFSGAKSVTEKMTDDLRDYANHAKGWHGLCSRCEKFPNETDLKTSETAEITFVTPLERVIYHADWCRLCQYLLRNLSRRENDPLLHPQISEFIQPHLKGKTFSQWINSGLRSTDAHWPFGHGKERKEGVFFYLDPVDLRNRAKRRAALATSSLIPMMMKVISSDRDSPIPRTQGGDPETSNSRIAEPPKRNDANVISEDDLTYPLECFLHITIWTHADPIRSGQIQVSLMGYGREPGAKLSTLSQFPLRVREDPCIGTPEVPMRYGNLIGTRQINMRLGATLLHDCEINHGADCSEQSWSSSVQVPPTFRVIDIVNNCILEAPTMRDFRFVALSYVWGEPSIETLKLTRFNIRELSQRDGLREFWHGVPTTVKDAIEVVRRVGELYIFVDALCILQDEDLEQQESLHYMKEERSLQTAAMDWVYSKAIFTIVAADSETSMMGIAGVREHTRFLKQDTVLLESGLRLLTPIDVPEDLDESIWNSRAWTFQERLLSRRLLIFQGGQMIWHCRKAVAHEDMKPLDKAIDYSSLSWLDLRKQTLGVNGEKDGSIVVLPNKTTHVVRSETFAEYAQFIEQYSERELSKEEDILEACGGLLQIFRQFFKFPLRYGVPEILFDVAILWEPTAKLEERITDSSYFPSWSWAGWIGGIKYPTPFLAKTDELLGTLRRLPPRDGLGREERIRPLVRWHVKHKSNQTLSPLNKSGLGVPLFAAKSAFPKEWNTRYAAPLQASDLPADMLSILGPHHVIFRTSATSRLTLGKLTPQALDAVSNPSDPPLRYALLLMARKVGTLLLDGEATPSLGAQHEFIVLSEAQYYGLDFEPGGVEDYPLFNIMLVEWNQQRTAARRLGLGKVDKKAWERAETVEKIVCLE